MENKALLLVIGVLSAQAIMLSGCITHKEGYVNGTVVVNGSAIAENLDRYVIEIGEGTDPQNWTMLGVTNVNGGSASREETFLGDINTSMLPDGKYTIRLTVTDKNGVSSEDRVYVNIDNIPDAQTRTCPNWTCGSLKLGANPVNISLTKDQYGSNMDCSVDCICQGTSKMGVMTVGDLEEDFDYLMLGEENLTGQWEGYYGNYNSTTRIRFTSDRSIDGSGDYGGFNVSEVVCSNYCFSAAMDYGGEYISNVTVGTDTMSSNKSYYSNYQYTAFTRLLRGHTYTLYVEVTVEEDYSYKEYAKAWIDYNQNTVLNDTGEEINLGNATIKGSYTFSKSFTVPPGAALGRTALRVSNAWYTAPTACGYLYYGEVEDYWVDIVDSLTSTTSTTLAGQCSMPGDDPPCGEVTMQEVIAHINKWAAGTADLGEVIDLINAWAKS